MSINSFTRDIENSNQLVRGTALRVLASIRVREIVQIQLISLKKCASDPSPYVRKTAAHSCGKIFQTDNEAKGEVVEVIETLLADRNTQVLSSAFAAFNEVCPSAWEVFSPQYRRLSALLADFDDWGQIAALGVFTRYARVMFAQPPVGAPAKAKAVQAKDFYGNEDESDDDDDSDNDSESDDESEEDVAQPGAVPEDLSALLRVAAPLLRSRNSGVVLAVAQLFAAIGAHDTLMLPKVGRALVRVSRNYREIQFIVLSNIVTLARSTPSMFRDYIKDFFVAESEAVFVRRMKVDVLAALVDADNAGQILREFTRYVKDDDKDFVRHSIQAVVRVANALPEVADKCLRGLMGLVVSGGEAVVAEAVVAIRQLLQQHSHHDALIVRLVQRLDKITSPSARAAIVWVLGEFQAKAKVAAIAPDALRVLVKGFTSEAGEVKVQIVNLAAKASLHHQNTPAVQALFSYVLDLARYDQDYDLRDRARLLRYLVLGSEVTQLAADALEEMGAAIALPRDVSPSADGETLSGEVAAAAAAAVAAEEAAAERLEAEEAGLEGAAAFALAPMPCFGSTSPVLTATVPPSHALSGRSRSGTEAASARLQDRVAAVLLASKPPPLISSALETSGGANFVMGSLSSIVGHAAKGYLALPPWASENSSPKLRDPPSEDEDCSGRRKKVVAAVNESDDSSDKEDDDESDDETEEESDDDDDGEFKSAFGAWRLRRLPPSPPLLPPR